MRCSFLSEQNQHFARCASETTDQQNPLCCGEQIVTSISIIIWVSHDSRCWVHLSTLMNPQQLPGLLQITGTGGRKAEKKARSRINQRIVYLRARSGYGDGKSALAFQLRAIKCHQTFGTESATEDAVSDTPAFKSPLGLTFVDLNIKSETSRLL